jgi:hypothetical protein
VTTEALPPGALIHVEGELLNDARRIVEVQLAAAMLAFADHGRNADEINSYVALARALGAWPYNAGLLWPLAELTCGDDGLRRGHLMRLERAARHHIDQAREVMEGAFPEDADEEQVVSAAGQELQRAMRLLRRVKRELG